MEITEDRLLGGRMIYCQPANGFRSGIEPVLLAAAIPVKPGEHVLEGGTGAGAALLCLHARVPGFCSVGVEADEAVAELAARNARVNAIAGMDVKAARLESVALCRTFDHAIANPPYHPADGTSSALTSRDAAKRGSADLLRVWIDRLASRLRSGGTLTLIVPAGRVPVCLSAMTAAQCDCTVIFPLWPKTGQAAKLVIIRGVKDSRTPMRLSAGLTLHQTDGEFTATAQSILRGGTALMLG